MTDTPQIPAPPRSFAPIPQPHRAAAPIPQPAEPVRRPSTPVPQPEVAPIPVPPPSRAQVSKGHGEAASEASLTRAPAPTNDTSAPGQFTSEFQRFVSLAPVMPGSGAVQYPQAPPQAVQAWAMPTPEKKLPIFEALVIGAGAGLMLVGILGYLLASGPFLALFLAICCLVPLGIIVLFLQFVDRFEPEPWWTKTAAFLWGGGVAVFFAGLSNTLSKEAVANATGNVDAGKLFVGVVAAPLGEELMKALGVLVIVMIRRDRISSPLDGLVYAGFSAAGFLVVEDFGYFVGAVYDGRFAQTFFVRVFMGVFGHVMYTTCTGWAIGWAVTRTRSVGAGIGAVLVAYLIAVSLHGLWNGSAAIARSEEMFYVIYVFVHVPLFCCWLCFVATTMRRERRDIAAGLIPYLNQGWVLAGEVQMVCDPAFRRNALRWVSGGGAPAKKAMKNFMYALASLGLDQVVMNVRGAEQRRIESTRDKLQEATRDRQVFLTLMGVG